MIEMTDWLITKNHIVHYCDCSYVTSGMKCTNLWIALEQGNRICKHCLHKYLSCECDQIFQTFHGIIKNVYWEYNYLFFGTVYSYWCLNLVDFKLWHTRNLDYPAPFSDNFHFQKECISLYDAVSYGVEHDKHHPYVSKKPFGNFSVYQKIMIIEAQL